jgi:signal transduction histidine kinase
MADEGSTDNVLEMREYLARRDFDQEIFLRLFIDSPFPIQIVSSTGMPRRTNDAHAAFVHAYGERLGIGEGNVLEDEASVAHGHAVQFQKAFSGEVVDYELSTTAMSDPTSERVWFDRVLVPVSDGRGAVGAVVSVIMDVTDRKRMEDERVRLNEQLLHAQKLESLGVLAGGIAHDFNNLLVAVLGNASLLLTRLPDSSPLREYAEGIEVAARRAADVAHQMLAYSGRGQFVVEPVDVSKLLDETADLLRLGVSRRVALVRELAPGLPAVSADETQLRQVVMNLLTNASESFGERSGRVVLRTGVVDVSREYLSRCVRVTEAEPGRYVFIEVSDTGVGMDRSMVEKIFDPFFTTKFTGRGLGLAAVFGIVRGHGGAIHVDAALGRGTTFRVLLPALVDRPSAAGTTPEGSSERVRGSGLVVVVDDEEGVRPIVARLLGDMGYSTVECATGEEALRVLSGEAADAAVVLLDVTMPGISGLEVLARLRARGNRVPVVLMSGYDVSFDEQDVTDTRQVRVLNKPFSYDDVAKVLVDLIG